MKIKSKKIVSLLRERKDLAKEGLKSSKVIEKKTKKYVELKEAQKEIEAKLKKEVEKLKIDPVFVEAEQKEKQIMQQMAERQAKVSSILHKGYLEKLEDRENFGKIEILNDDEVEVEVIDETIAFVDKLKKQKQDVIKAAKGVK